MDSDVQGVAVFNPAGTPFYYCIAVTNVSSGRNKQIKYSTLNLNQIFLFLFSGFNTRLPISFAITLHWSLYLEIFLDGTAVLVGQFLSETSQQLSDALP